MARVGFYLKVKPEKLDEYRERHREVWPSMLEALRETGWKNYSLFLRPDGILFGYVELDNLGEAVRAMSEREVNAQWQAEMAPFFEQLEGNGRTKALFRWKKSFIWTKPPRSQPLGFLHPEKGLPHG